MSVENRTNRPIERVEVHEIAQATTEEVIQSLEEKQGLQRELTAMLKRTLVLRNWLANHEDPDVREKLGDPMKGTLKTQWTGSAGQGWIFTVSRGGEYSGVSFNGRDVPSQIRSRHAQEVVQGFDMKYGDAKDRFIAEVADSLRLDRKILRTAMHQNKRTQA